MKKSIYIIIDSLDENTYFFDENGTAYFGVLQSFINSFVNPEFLGLALGEDEVRAFEVLIFLPTEKDLKLNWARIDKIPINHITWNDKTLNNYADFILYHLQMNSSRQCKKNPNFAKLMGGYYSANKVLKKIRHTRDLHIFMNKIFELLNRNCYEKYTQNQDPFIATQEEIDEALKLARQAMLNATD